MADYKTRYLQMAEAASCHAVVVSLAAVVVQRNSSQEVHLFQEGGEEEALVEACQVAFAGVEASLFDLSDIRHQNRLLHIFNYFTVITA